MRAAVVVVQSRRDVVGGGWEVQVRRPANVRQSRRVRVGRCDGREGGGTGGVGARLVVHCEEADSMSARRTEQRGGKTHLVAQSRSALACHTSPPLGCRCSRRSWRAALQPRAHIGSLASRRAVRIRGQRGFRKSGSQGGTHQIQREECVAGALAGCRDGKPANNLIAAVRSGGGRNCKLNERGERVRNEVGESGNVPERLSRTATDV